MFYVILAFLLFIQVRILHRCTGTCPHYTNPVLGEGCLSTVVVLPRAGRGPTIFKMADASLALEVPDFEVPRAWRSKKSTDPELILSIHVCLAISDVSNCRDKGGHG